jgi:hypothetical protein
MHQALCFGGRDGSVYTAENASERGLGLYAMERRQRRHTLIPRALEHSGHKLKSKGLMAMLSNGALFKKDEQFMQLQPIYDVSSSDIEAYIKSLLMAK